MQSPGLPTASCPTSCPSARCRTGCGTGRSAGLVRVRAEHAVGAVDQLVGERRDARLQQLLADLGPVAPEERHLELAQARAGGQRREARELDDLPRRRQPPRSASGSVTKTCACGSDGAEHAAAVEVVARAPVPEVVEVERRRLHRRRVARLDPAEALEARNRIELVAARGAQVGHHRLRRRSWAGWNCPMGAMSVNLLKTTPIDDTTSLTSLTMLAASQTTCGRRRRVIERDRADVGDDRRRARRVAGDVGVRELVQREVGRREIALVRLHEVEGEVAAEVVRVDLVLGARVDAGAGEVAGAARLHAVAADLHVPEQRLAERRRDVAIADVVVLVGRRHVVRVGVDEVVGPVRTAAHLGHAQRRLAQPARAGRSDCAAGSRRGSDRTGARSPESGRRARVTPGTAGVE